MSFFCTPMLRILTILVMVYLIAPMAYAGEKMQGGEEYCQVTKNEREIEIYGPWNFKLCHFPEMVRDDKYVVEKVKLPELQQRLKDALEKYQALNIVIVAQDWTFNYYHKYRHKKTSSGWQSGLWEYGRNPFGAIVTKKRIGLPENTDTAYEEMLIPEVTAYIVEKKTTSLARK